MMWQRNRIFFFGLDLIIFNIVTLIVNKVHMLLLINVPKCINNSFIADEADCSDDSSCDPEEDDNYSMSSFVVSDSDPYSLL